MRKSKSLSAGFTLVEAAAVVLVGGLTLMAMSSVLNNSLDIDRVALTQSRMQEIESALSEYLSVNGVLPCVARLNDAPDTATFGIAINTANPNACAASVGAGTFRAAGNAPPIVIANPVNTRTIVFGAVPVRTLNLPDQDMIDAWGNRFLFAVTDYLTVPGNYNPSQGTIGVVDNSNPSPAAPPSKALVGPASGLNPNSYAQYVIVSYGANHAGAYTLAGGNGVPCPTAAANRYESVNCTLPTATFRKGPVIGDQAADSTFDDYLLYHSQMSPGDDRLSDTPKGIILPFTNMTVCPTGWAAYGDAPGTGSGVSPPPLNTPTTPLTCTPPTTGAITGVCCQKL